MHRYLKLGAALDAIDGKRVLVVAPRIFIPGLLNELAELVGTEARHVTKANGEQQISTHRGGWIVLKSTDPTGLRGFDAHVVLIPHDSATNLVVNAAVCLNAEPDSDLVRY